MNSRNRPADAGQESVWDYPRPPIIEPTDRHLRVMWQGEVIAETRRALRVLETSHPPTYYFPPEDVRLDILVPMEKYSFCEFKGKASYFAAVMGTRRVPSVAWTYAKPTPGSGMKADYIAFYAAPFDGCWVDGERVTPQPGNFYGGWITSHVTGPFKGSPGSGGW